MTQNFLVDFAFLRKFGISQGIWHNWFIQLALNDSKSLSDENLQLIYWGNLYDIFYYLLSENQNGIVFICHETGLLLVFSSQKNPC